MSEWTPKRLREQADMSDRLSVHSVAFALNGAADKIERLRAENGALTLQWEERGKEIVRLRAYIREQCQCLAPGDKCDPCAFLDAAMGGDDE